VSVELLHGDCMEYMAGLADGAFDLAIVDPPYGISWTDQVVSVNEGKNWIPYENKQWDSSPPPPAYFAELFRVSQNQVVFGGNYMTDNLRPSPCWVIWDKCQEFSGADFEMAWTSFASPSKAFRMARCVAYTAQMKVHPTQKPVALYRWLLHNYAKPGWRILDTHLGSGSSAIAAHEMGFDFVGLEIDTDYIAAARKRFDLMTRQTSLDL